MTAPSAVVFAIAASIAGALVSALLTRRPAAAGWVAFLATLVSSALALYAAALGLWRGPQAETFASLPRLGSDVRLAVDGLSAVFLALAAVVAVLAALYSLSYLRRYAAYGAGRYYPWLLLFVAGMYGIVTTTDLGIVFFAFWQLMTLPSYLLIRYEHDKPAHVRAALRYLLMMEIAVVAVVAGAALLARGVAPAGTAPYDFEALRGALPGLLRDHGGLAAAGLTLFLVGFGIKAGMWPFGQMWLPDAHPAAPSPVSALLSGVMIKTGVYGLMRSFIWLVPAEALTLYPAAVWGGVIATLGTITLFVGTLQALAQGQTKRLLAYSSIGQIGYILLGLGAAVVFLGRGSEAGADALAALALSGALLHVVNHGTFKSLLFLNAGSMLHATGTQDLDRMGGLMKYMPLTAVTAFIASLSIAGVPLFNGFASKWAIWASAILGGRGAAYLPAYGVVAILTSALTLILYMKFFGAGFLSRTSALVGERAERERLEVDWRMQTPQVILAALCVVVGLVPSLAYGALRTVLSRADGGLLSGAGAGLSQAPGGAGGIVLWTAADGRVALAPLVLVVLLGGLLVLVHLLSRAGAASRRATEAWLCGYAQANEGNRYAAQHLYGDLRRRLRRSA